jgi:hypothetical protein
MVNTDPMRIDNLPRPRSTIDDLADEIEALSDGHGLSIRSDLGPAVVRELERREHKVERHLYGHGDDGEPRLLVRIDRVPA